MRTNQKVIFATILASLPLSAVISKAATTGWANDAGGDYNTQANWVGNSINGIFDASLTFTAARTITFATNTNVSTGLVLNYLGSAPTFRGTGGNFTLTLGGNITRVASSSQTTTFGSVTNNQNLNVDLGGTTRTFLVSGGGNGNAFISTFDFVNKLSNGSVQISGGGRVRMHDSANSLSNITLGGAELTINGLSSTVNTVNTVTGAFTSAAPSAVGVLGGLTGSAGSTGLGGSIVTLATPNAKNVQFNLGSFARNAGGTVLFRGSNLGVNSIASNTASASNIVINNTTNLLTGGGGNANTSTVGIIVGAIGDTLSTGTGFGSTGGLVTYDSTNGVRLLNNSEYTSSIADLQTQLDNVRYVNTSGSGVITTTLSTGTTTINSLSISETGAGSNSGVTINGTTGTVLKISSGMVYYNQAVTTVATTDAATISTNVTLDFNNKEAIFATATNGFSSGNTSGALFVNGVISNAATLTITSGTTSGEVVFGGASSNTYTGTTTLNSGVLKLAKTGGAVAIAGNFVINGGTLLQDNNQFSTSSNVTVNGGTFVFSNSTSNGNTQAAVSVNNFTMNGGSISFTTGLGGSLTIAGTATLTGWLGNTGLSTQSKGTMTVGGLMSISQNGLLTVRTSSTANNTFETTTTLNGGLSITNPDALAFTPVVINPGGAANTNGGRLVLAGDLTFVGNGTNTNTATISAPTGTGNRGVLALNGSRAFNIGDGAATTDFTIAPAIIDGASAGRINKSGNGVLLLTGLNTYTGGTSVLAGRLAVASTSSLGTGDVQVASGAILELDSDQLISDTANVTLDGGVSKGRVDLAFSNALFEKVNSLTLGGVTYSIGVFNASTNPDYFTGTGNIYVPEPGSLSLTFCTAAGLMARRRRRPAMM